MNAIQVSDLTYHYPGAPKASLHNVNCNIGKGTFTVIMGETGAGKSTLLMSLNGVIPKMMEGTQSGDVKLEGQSIQPYRVQTITEYVGLVMQDAESQILGRTVEEDVMFGPRNYLVPRDEIIQRVNESLDRVRLKGFEKREATSLSGGEKQRLTIASILALNPQILLLDEPTSELDPLGREEIYSTIDSLRKNSDMTMLVVEHSSEDICEKAEHLMILQEGRLTWEGRPQEFFKDYDLVVRNGIKPIAVSAIGWQLMEAGLISRDEIPLNVEEAVTLIRNLIKDQPIPTPRAKKPRDTDVLIKVENLSFSYTKEKPIFENMNLEINQGDFVAIIGQNGAGKTTLAKQLNGLLTPISGKIFIDGKDVTGEKPEMLASTIGYVFQNPDHQIFSTTVYNEILYGLKLAKLPQSEIDQRIEEVLEFTNLQEFKEVHPFSMGKGERQKLAVASILALKPKILVVDEPTTGQDWKGIQVMMGLMKTLNEQGTTIIMITHDMDVVSSYANHVVLMNEGEILLEGRPEEVLAETELLRKASVTTTQVVRLCKELNMPVYLDGNLLAESIINIAKGERA